LHNQKNPIGLGADLILSNANTEHSQILKQFDKYAPHLLDNWKKVLLFPFLEAAGNSNLFSKDTWGFKTHKTRNNKYRKVIKEK